MTAPWWIIALVLLWLAIITWSDLRTFRAPRPAWAWIGLPAAAAALWRASQGGWLLTLTALIIYLVSERQRLPPPWANRAWSAAVLAFTLVVIAAFQTYLTWTGFMRDYMNPALGMGVFWQLFELKKMRGVDSLTVIALLLLWPGWLWIVVWAVVTQVYIYLWRYYWYLARPLQSPTSEALTATSAPSGPRDLWLSLPRGLPALRLPVPAALWRVVLGSDSGRRPPGLPAMFLATLVYLGVTGVRLLG